ncbi:MAG: LysR family transcriptional regulator [Paracoccaceae bacterium]
MNWDDLQILLALQRGGSRAQAARLMHVDKSTITRRIEALERALSQVLVERDARGRMTLTDFGAQVAARAEAIEDQASDIRALARQAASPAQTRLRVTAVPLIVNHVLLPRVGPFLADHPDVALELVAEARDLSLIHREADIAIRLARPRDGGHEVLSRHIGMLPYAAYAAAHTSGPQPWIGYDRTMQFLSHAAAISEAGEGQGQAALAVNDAETLFQAVLGGLGQSLFPVCVAQDHPRLRRIDTDITLPEREVWLLIRRDLRDLKRVQAVTGWLCDCLS